MAPRHRPDPAQLHYIVAVAVAGRDTCHNSPPLMRCFLWCSRLKAMSREPLWKHMSPPISSHPMAIINFLSPLFNGAQVVQAVFPGPQCLSDFVSKRRAQHATNCHAYLYCVTPKSAMDIWHWRSLSSHHISVLKTISGYNMLRSLWQCQT